MMRSVLCHLSLLLVSFFIIDAANPELTGVTEEIVSEGELIAIRGAECYVQFNVPCAEIPDGQPKCDKICVNNVCPTPIGDRKWTDNWTDTRVGTGANSWTDTTGNEPIPCWVETNCGCKDYVNVSTGVTSQICNYDQDVNWLDFHNPSYVNGQLCVDPS